MMHKIEKTFDKKSSIAIFNYMKAIRSSLLVLVLLPSTGGICA